MATGDTGTVGTAQTTNHIQTVLTQELKTEVGRQRVFDQLTKVAPESELGGAVKGTTVNIRFRRALPIQDSTLTEKADINPVTSTGLLIPVSINEYGNAVQLTHLSEIATHGDLRADLTAQIAENMVRSIDRVAGRLFYEGNDIVRRANGVTNRSDLDSTNDTLSASGVGMTFLAEAQTILRGAGAPGFGKTASGLDNYTAPIHTALVQDLPDTNGYIDALQQQSGREELFNGEVGTIRGLSFLETAQGKVYPGAGTTAQSATTIDAAAAEGAATISVASATGLAVGDHITIGTLEDGSTVTTETNTNESVLITAVDGTTLTVAGYGYVEAADGTITAGGLRFSHASGAAVTEAALVAAIPVVGPESIIKAFDVTVGPFGEAKVTGPFDRLGRFTNVGWYAVQGWAKSLPLWNVRLEVATASSHIVTNE